MTQQSARSFEKHGSVPQFAMITLYLVQLALYGTSAGPLWSLWRMPDLIGMLLFAYCLLTLYGKGKARLNRLITTGPFRYTRHPMYTGLFLMNTAFWFPVPASTQWHFFLLQALFVACMIAAAWFQEKETLARFGAEAEEYYRRTPRLILWYPVCWVRYKRGLYPRRK